MARTVVTNVAGSVLGVIDGVTPHNTNHHRPLRKPVARPSDPAARPPVDWTGHTFKAVKELTVNFDRPRGRAASVGPRPRKSYVGEL